MTAHTKTNDNKGTIQFLPMGKNPVTEGLKLATAIKLLSSRLAMMEVMFNDEEQRAQVSYEDWEEYVSACEFVNEYDNARYKFPLDEVREFLITEGERLREDSRRRAAAHARKQLYI